jgi:hypothetical protein
MKKLLLILSVFALFSASLFATSARIDGLGFGGCRVDGSGPVFGVQIFPANGQ